MTKKKSSALKFPLQAHPRDRATKAPVPAVAAPMSESDVELWGLWQYPKDAADRGWDWESIFAEAQAPGSEMECYAVVAREALQGLMAVVVEGKPTPEGVALGVDYLASNPVNRDLSGGLKDVGFILVVLAVRRSVEIGWNGRLWLESLPDAEEFYVRCGFSRLPGKSAEGNAMFWLTGAAADVILATARATGILSPI
jgi:hypothetical protein